MASYRPGTTREQIAEIEAKREKNKPSLDQLVGAKKPKGKGPKGKPLPKGKTPKSKTPEDRKGKGRSSAMDGDKWRSLVKRMSRHR